MQLNAASLTLPCSDCGAGLIYVPDRRVLQCDHCASLSDMADEAPRHQHVEGVTAQAIIPLSVDGKTLDNAFQRYLAACDMPPDGFVEDAVLTEKTCFYLPVHAFAGNYDPALNASFGADRKGPDAESFTREENGRSQRIGLSRKVKAGVWRPPGGLERGDFTVLACAASDELGAAPGLSELLAHIDADLAEPFRVEFISGIPVLPHSLNEMAAWNQYGKPVADAIIERDMKHHAQDNRIQGLRWGAVIDKLGKPLLVPMWRVVYEFQGKSYRLWFDGVDASHVAGDPAPSKRTGKRAATLGWLPFLVALTAAAHAFGLGLELGWSWITLLATFVFALARSTSVPSNSTSKFSAWARYDWFILPLLMLLAWLIPVNAPEKPIAQAHASASVSAPHLASETSKIRSRIA